MTHKKQAHALAHQDKIQTKALAGGVTTVRFLGEKPGSSMATRKVPERVRPFSPKLIPSIRSSQPATFVIVSSQGTHRQGKLLGRGRAGADRPPFFSPATYHYHFTLHAIQQSVLLCMQSAQKQCSKNYSLMVPLSHNLFNGLVIFTLILRALSSPNVDTGQL